MLAQSVMPAPVLAASGRPAGPVDLGVLTVEITPELVDEVIELSGCREKRQRLLPAVAVVYFVLGLCLFSGADSCAPPVPVGDAVADERAAAPARAGAAHQFRPDQGAAEAWLQAAGAAVRPAAGAAGQRGHGRGIRVRAAAGRLGRDRDRRGGHPGERPRVRRHPGRQPAGAAAGADRVRHARYHRRRFDGLTKASEHKLARRLLHALGPGMLLLADRNFAGHELWGLVTAAGADMAWRIKKNLVLPPVKILPDGSFLSIMPTPADSLRHGQARARGKPLRRTRRATSSGSSSTP